MEAEQPVLADDGLHTTRAGAWSLEKYRIFRFYAEMFSTGMKRKWKNLVYVDLFAGAGYAKVKGSGELVLGSPLLALSVPDRFTRYVLCDIDERSVTALQQRVRRHAADADVHYVTGDCNEKVDEIVEKARRGLAIADTLAFCFADPFNVELRFETFANLSRRFNRVDFLILLALWMDARRNELRYRAKDNPRIDALLDDPDWRDKCESERNAGVGFGCFLAKSFSDRMTELGYSVPAKIPWHEIRLNTAGMPLYHLMFFSKHERGYDFWEKAKRYGATQKELKLGL